MAASRSYGPKISGVLVLCVASADFGNARGQDPAALCDQAAQQAAAKSAVPVDVLRAITRVETGRQADGRLQPWPWAINIAGAGHWFPDAAAALAFGYEQLATGNENFDVGCFQINLHWHGSEFVSLDAAFDPVANATYAARFLTDLYQSEGSWSAAVAAYHSRTPDKAAGYLQKVESVLVSLGPISNLETVAYAADEPRQNRFPLLQKGAAGAGASLVPLVQNATPLIGAQ
jgi:hypothetical protein